jgi:hypothetical protein
MKEKIWITAFLWIIGLIFLYNGAVMAMSIDGPSIESYTFGVIGIGFYIAGVLYSSHYHKKWLKGLKKGII